MRRDRHAFEKLHEQETRERMLRQIAKRGLSLETVETLIGCAIENQEISLEKLGKDAKFMKILLDVVRVKEENKKPANPLTEEVDSSDYSAGTD